MIKKKNKDNSEKNMKIAISIGDKTLYATLNDSATATAVEEILPVTVRMSRWGEEYYGEVPVEMPLASEAKEIMEVGDGGTGGHFVSFHVAAGKVNPVGMIMEKPEVLSGFGSSVTAQIKKVK